MMTTFPAAGSGGLGAAELAASTGIASGRDSNLAASSISLASVPVFAAGFESAEFYGFKLIIMIARREMLECNYHF